LALAHIVGSQLFLFQAPRGVPESEAPNDSIDPSITVALYVFFRRPFLFLPCGHGLWIGSAVLRRFQESSVCGKSRTASEICTGGTCVGCPSTSTQCKDQCADLTQDPFNCGGCGKTCAASQTCVAGACSACTGLLCSNICVDARTDPNNCGACGVTCDAGQCCHDGACTHGTQAAAFCQHP